MELKEEDQESNNDKLRMKKQLHLLDGISITLGIILGSGIFITPKDIIQEVHSIALSLIIWTSCGFLSLLGALCYAELGTTIPKSGGDYAYIFEGFGALPAFLYLWAANMIFIPTTNAIMSLTFAHYIIKPFSPHCAVNETSVLLIAALSICLLTFINGTNVKSTSKMQNILMFSKIGALMLIIFVGFYWMVSENENYLNNFFENTNATPQALVKAFYSGIFTYSGWNYLNFMTEELQNPYKNLPRAIYISLPVVTILYVFANIAYIAVLGTEGVLKSTAIAVTFGNQVNIPGLSVILTLMIAIAAFGGLSVHIMTSSRMLFVGARNGHFPKIFAHLSTKHLTPIIALIFLCILSLFMLLIKDITILITYCTFVESFFCMLSVIALIRLRLTKRDLYRPIKINLVIPIVFVMIFFCLTIISLMDAPYETGFGVLLTSIGIPFYYTIIKRKFKSDSKLNKFNESITIFLQKLLITAHADE